MMTRYRVIVTEQKAYILDASTPERAGDKAIAMSAARIAPDYPSTITAKADVVAEPIVELPMKEVAACKPN